jgi:hypothetical protein
MALPKAFLLKHRSAVIPILRIFCRLFFAERYLRGRHFDAAFTGWRWALRAVWQQKILGFNRSVPWPCAATARISTPQNVQFDVDDMNNFQAPGLYLQCFLAKIVLGKGTYLGPNVGIITANHRFDDLDQHSEGKAVVIGEKCWIGMNSVILPGVVLGPNTVVGAGSVVTKSFPAGYQVIAGNPARVLRPIERSQCNS